jgi:magnesium-transporting ATPase (P-type)
LPPVCVAVLASGLLGFWQERGASNAVEKLLSIVRITAAVLRDGSAKEIPVEEIVPGDIVVLDSFRVDDRLFRSGRITVTADFLPTSANIFPT